MTYHRLLQAFEILSGLFSSVLHHPGNTFHHYHKRNLFTSTLNVSVLCATYVRSCSLRLFSWSVDLSFSCSTFKRSCSSMIFWFRLQTQRYVSRWTLSNTFTKVFVWKAYSCSSVMSFSLISSSSLRLLSCFWWASLWLWICCSTAVWTQRNLKLQSLFKHWESVLYQTLIHLWSVHVF